MNIDKRFIYINTILLSFLIIFTLYKEVNFLLFLMISIWILMFTDRVLKLKDNFLVVSFLITIFVFLIGREVLFYYFDLERYYLYLEPYNNFAYFSIILNLIAVWLGILFFERSKKNKRNIKNTNIKSETKYFVHIISKFVYIFCFPFSLIELFYEISKVRKVGYLGRYIGATQSVPGIVAYIASFTFVAFCFYLASKPRKREAKIFMLSYLLIAVLTVFTGKRYPFVGTILLLISYMYMREKS